MDPHGAGERLERRLVEALQSGLKEAADELLERAKRDAPVKTGRLRASGRVDVDRQQNGARATVSFDTPYALYQHEAKGYEHHGGGPKFLERNLLGIGPAVERKLADAVRRVT